ncbi:MAG: TIGR03560 family F420-dependent LLM class oxidoreductase [Chloroflexota bacterium]
MEIAIMVEGQNGLNWKRWKNIAAAVEDLGYFGLFRSDHFTNMSPPDKDSLELWISLTWLASNSRRIQFGPLVTPFSFRHPVITARMASAVDDLSGGRLILGLGAGWQKREHDIYGFELMEPEERFDRMEDGLKLIKSLFESDEIFNYEGSFFQAKEAIMLPRPLRNGGPTILIGGIGKNRTLPLAAKYAGEWNAMFLDPIKYRNLNAEMNRILHTFGRAPESLTKSMMTGLRFGRTKQELRTKMANSDSTTEDLRKRGIIVGVGGEIKTQLMELENAGLQRLMLQWLDLDDLEGLAALAKVVL